MQAFKALKAICMSTLFSHTDAKGHNPLWPSIQYQGTTRPSGSAYS